MRQLSDFPPPRRWRPFCWCWNLAKETSCSNGFPGIDGTNDRGSVCCAAQCGQCGEEGCGSIEGFDNTNCCVNGVLDNQPLCSEIGSAPCVIDDGDGGETRAYHTLRPDTEPPNLIDDLANAWCMPALEQCHSVNTAAFRVYFCLER